MVWKVRHVAATLLLTAAVGCGGSSLTADNVAQPQSEIRAAEEAGAGNVPKAGLHLKMAKDQLAAGNKLAEDGKDEQASRAYARAKSDAELSLLLARHATLKAKAQEAMDKTTALEKAPPGASTP